MSKKLSVRKILSEAVWLLPAIAAAAMYICLPGHSEFVETVFSGKLFRWLSYIPGLLTSLLPFSLTELVVVVGLPGLAVFSVIRIIILLRKRRAGTILRDVKVFLRTVSVGLLIYMLFHGANFYRQPLTELMGLPEAEADAELLYDVTADLASELNTLRTQVSEDSEGCMVLKDGIRGTLREASEVCNSSGLRFLHTGVLRAKPVVISHLWSYTGITGMYMPIAVEANVNTDVSQSELPATALHELCHTCGFAREDECNFLAWYVGVNSGNSDFAYSGTMLAYIYCFNDLYDYDKDKAAELRSTLSAAVKRDLVQRNTYWKQFEGEVEEKATKVNDTFLSTQGMEEGVVSYSRMVKLVLAEYIKEGFTED